MDLEGCTHRLHVSLNGGTHQVRVGCIDSIIHTLPKMLLCCVVVSGCVCAGYPSMWVAEVGGSRRFVLRRAHGFARPAYIRRYAQLGLMKFTSDVLSVASPALLKVGRPHQACRAPLMRNNGILTAPSPAAFSGVALIGHP